MKKIVYLVLPSQHIGGAEKRFLAFWLYTQQQACYPLHLVITQALYEKLEGLAELAAIQQFTHAITVLPCESGQVQAVQRAWYQQIKQPGILIHFIMGYPLFLDKTVKKIFTLTESSLHNLNYKGKLASLSYCWQADCVDVLDPATTIWLKRYFPRQKKITQTVSSFVDAELYAPVPFVEKKNWLVFLGRFVPMKQILGLARALPLIHARLMAQQVQEVRYFLLGYGEQQAELMQLIQQPEYQGIPIQVSFEANPVNILKYAKIFYSLQQNTNYPSKSLLEAMACGNLPLVTDVGSTRLIAPPDCSFYVDEDFTAEQLATQTVAALTLPAPDMAAKMASARQFVTERFAMRDMAAYYYAIYDQLAGSA